jgi:hypothetical protein
MMIVGQSLECLIWRRNRNTLRKPVPLLLRSPPLSHDLTRLEQGRL